MVTAIADSAFAGCTNVTRVVVPNSVTFTYWREGLSTIACFWRTWNFLKP